MFATIEWQQNATLNNVLQDITDVITGETDVSNLSADVVQGNSEISVSISTSPWTLHDDVAGGHKQIRCQQTDSGVFKHIGLHHKSDTLANAMYSISCMDDWNNVTHAGTDITGPDYSFNQVGARQDIAAFQYYLYADEFMIYILPHSDFDRVGNSEGANVKQTGIGTWEVDRTNPSMAIGDMPNWFIGSTGIFGGDTNTKTRFASFWQGRDTEGAIAKPMTSYGGVACRGQYNWSTEKYNSTINACLCPADVSGANRYAVEHLIMMSSGFDAPTNVNVGTYLGSVSARSNIWALPEGSQPVLSVMNYNGLNYVILKAAHDTGTTGLNPGFKVMVPNG